MTTTSTPDDRSTGTVPRRRAFFGWITCALAAVATALAGVPVLGFLLRVRKTEVDWVKLGAVDDFPVGQTRVVAFDNPLRQPWDGVTAETEVFVRNEGGDGNEGSEGRQSAEFLVLAVNCAHLGCGVSWFPESGLFMCPCHGGVYYADGQRASGPPPRGLYHCVWRVRGGQLEIQAPHFPTLHGTLEQQA